MISISRLTFVAMSMAGLTACGTSEAIFVTTTTIGINAETTPPNLTFAYDRYEGFFGPADKDGNMPPVVARIESNHSVVNPRVKQLYATGAAAIDVTIDGKAKNAAGDVLIDKRRNTVAEQPNAERIVGDDRRVAFFGVAQTSGLKLTFGPTNVVDSVSIGYKRKEASYLPLVGKKVKDAKGNEVVEARYPSTLAALARNVEIASQSETSEGVTQFFATGAAARNLALSEPIRELFRQNAKEAITKTLDFGTRYSNDAGFRAAIDAWVAAEGKPGCDTVLTVRNLAQCEEIAQKMADVFKL